ncbi:phosphoglycerate mutase GpmB [Neolewinella maritima]|uniref:Phosphoglycerate mutase GpmB n=1 Tax=Neolewinella maritima TaxID=1383882 RepID=A0ABN8FEF2_9BACT|nr:histidine phosphatase family protein [Neolewinella maritima]CAH1002316.1 phosphoglycerate mutase GpmB [Neolewinella maritima]
MKTIYLVRHGQTDYNLRGIVQGSGVDASLNHTGETQARHFYRHYKDTNFDVVLTSVLKRSWETVQGFIDDGIPWEKHIDINEICWGSHEGKAGTKESIAEYKRVKDEWAAGELDGRIGGGESARELNERLQRFITHLSDRPEDKLLICSHGRAMCALVTLMMGRPISMMNELVHHNLGLWIGELQPDGLYKFSLQNDRTHIPEPLTLGKW